jgi:hypothetical protein
MEEGIVSRKEDLFAALRLRAIVVLVVLDVPDIPTRVKFAVQLDVYIVSLDEKVEVLFANGQEQYVEYLHWQQFAM